MSKGIYLASYKALHDSYDIDYQDINGKRDIGGDMLDVDMVQYDYIIATPPCNYWSRANYRRDVSTYSQNTWHLLPTIIDRLIALGKPFIVENVINKKLMNKYQLLNKNCFIYFIGRHTYWTNIIIPTDIPQTQQNVENLARTKRQGDDNVHRVIEVFLSIVNSRGKEEEHND